jgi:DNA-binding FadR family transcriptional regulator
MKFSPVGPQRLSDGVVHQITEAIASGRLRTGDKLPSQRELQQMFGSGRASVLEALRVLEASGLVITKRGSRGGTIVNFLPEKRLGDALSLMVQLNEVSLAELVEFRQVIEGNAAVSLSTRRSRGLLRELKVAVNQLGNANHDQTAEAWSNFMTLEVNCHQVLIRATKNRLMELVMSTLHTIMDEAFQRVPAGYRERILQDWGKLIAEAEEGNAESARRIIQVHIEDFAEIIKTQRPAASHGRPSVFANDKPSAGRP